MNNDLAISLATRATSAAMGVAQQRGWKQPEEYQRLIKLSAAAKQAARDADPAPVAKPTDAAGIPAWLQKVALDRACAAARREAATELATDADRQIGLLGQQYAAEAIALLSQEFEDEVRAYLALADAPRTLTGHETDAQVAAHTALLRAAGTLTNSANQRAILADVAGEGEDIGRDAIWLLIAMAPDATLDGVRSALAEFDRRLPASVADWDRLSPLGLALARHGEVAARKERHADALYKRGMSTPDGGLLDRSYREIDEADSHGAAGRLNSDANAAFNRAPALTI